MEDRKSIESKKEAFERLLNIMDELREKCPWDKKQSFESLRILTIEETYELADELLSLNMSGIREELGDLFLHLVFYSRLGEEIAQFDVADVLNDVCDKLIKRHPHIYSDIVAEDESAVKRNWEKIKLSEGKKSILQGVPDSLPALIKAYRMQEKTAQFGFQWENASDVLTKIREEETELAIAVANEDRDAMEAELGDVLFSWVNYARMLGLDPERALARTNKKFKSRFQYIEKNAEKELSESSLDEMEALWQQAKKSE